MWCKSFLSGEIRYGKNGHTIATLMFVDKTLPLWAFFDVYGSTQKIKSLGKLPVYVLFFLAFNTIRSPTAK